VARKATADDLFSLDNVVWPAVVTRVQALVKTPTTLRDALTASARAGGITAGDVLRGLEILTAAGLVAFRA
jgi:hypothetical protein